jgi:hypothetical protein
MIAAKCPCGANLRAPDKALGKKGRCPRCGISFPIVPWLSCPECRTDISIDADGCFMCNCQRHGHKGSRFVGQAGTIWINTTLRVRYQFCAEFHANCSICFRTSGRIGGIWGIPFVAGCTCRQRKISPGETSQPFTDVETELARTTPEQRDLIFGRNSRLLLDAGLVSWTDLVGRYSGTEFDYVIYNKSLSLESVLAAGVDEGEARASWRRVCLRRADEPKENGGTRKAQYERD